MAAVLQFGTEQWRQRLGGKAEGSGGRKPPPPAESRGGAPAPVRVWGQSPQKLKNDINFVLRITLVNAYRLLYSSYNYVHVCNWIFKKYVTVNL